jgi:hypothetical protein
LIEQHSDHLNRTGTEIMSEVNLAIDNAVRGIKSVKFDSMEEIEQEIAKSREVAALQATEMLAAEQSRR